MTNLSAREQRLIAILILVLLLFLAYRLALAPVIESFAAREEERSRLVTAHQRNERLIAALPILRQHLEAQRTGRALFALVAPNVDAAGSLLKERLASRLTAAGGSLRQTGDVDAEPGWIGASVEGDLTLDQLTAFLATLQNQPPYLVVTAVTVVADRAYQTGKLEVMSVKVDVEIPYSPAA